MTGRGEDRKQREHSELVLAVNNSALRILLFDMATR